MHFARSQTIENIHNTRNIIHHFYLVGYSEHQDIHLHLHLHLEHFSRLNKSHTATWH